MAEDDAAVISGKQGNANGAEDSVGEREDEGGNGSLWTRFRNSVRNDGEKQNDSSAAQQQDNRKKPPPVVKETVVEAETVKEDEDGDKKPAAKGSGEAKEEEKVHVSPVTMEEAIYNKERMKEALRTLGPFLEPEPAEDETGELDSVLERNFVVKNGESATEVVKLMNGDPSPEFKLLCIAALRASCARNNKEFCAALWETTSKEAMLGAKTMDLWMYQACQNLEYLATTEDAQQQNWFHACTVSFLIMECLKCIWECLVTSKREQLSEKNKQLKAANEEHGLRWNQPDYLNDVKACGSTIGADSIVKLCENNRGKLSTIRFSRDYTTYKPPPRRPPHPPHPWASLEEQERDMRERSAHIRARQHQRIARRRQAAREEQVAQLRAQNIGAAERNNAANVDGARAAANNRGVGPLDLDSSSDDDFDSLLDQFEVMFHPGSDFFNNERARNNQFPAPEGNGVAARNGNDVAARNSNDEAARNGNDEAAEGNERPAQGVAGANERGSSLTFVFGLPENRVVIGPGPRVEEDPRMLDIFAAAAGSNVRSAQDRPAVARADENRQAQDRAAAGDNEGSQQQGNAGAEGSDRRRDADGASNAGQGSNNEGFEQPNNAPAVANAGVRVERRADEAILNLADLLEALARPIPPPAANNEAAPPAANNQAGESQGNAAPAPVQANAVPPPAQANAVPPPARNNREVAYGDVSNAGEQGQANLARAIRDNDATARRLALEEHRRLMMARRVNAMDNQRDHFEMMARMEALDFDDLLFRPGRAAAPPARPRPPPAPSVRPHLKELRALEEAASLKPHSVSEGLELVEPSPDFDAEQILIKRVTACVGWAVHGLIFELVDGTRMGTLLVNPGETPMRLHDKNLSDRACVGWTDIEYGDYIVGMHGDKLAPGVQKWFCYSLTLTFASGKTVHYEAKHEPWRGEPFSFQVPTTIPCFVHRISFKNDQKEDMLGIVTSIHLPLSRSNFAHLPRKHKKAVEQMLEIGKQVDMSLECNGSKAMGEDVWWLILGFLRGWEFLPPSMNAKGTKDGQRLFDLYARRTEYRQQNY